MIARIGGRDDYAALFHEAGHTSTTRTWRRRCRWRTATWATTRSPRGSRSCSSTSPTTPPGSSGSWAWTIRARSSATRRAVKLVFVRRYCAKLAYELELHDADPPLGELPARYSAARLGRPRRLAAHHLARRRGPVLLCRPLPPRLGARDAPAAGAERALRAGLVRRAGGRGPLEQPMAPGPAARRRRAPGGAQRRTARSDGVGPGSRASARSR